MRAAVIRFPGSNCDQDCHHVLREFGFATDYLWHKESSAAGYDLIVLPGGFSYGDYLRCGAIARFSPVMKSVIEQAGRGVLVLGICNGFQILCESGLLPGALIRNRDMHFICEHVRLRVENTANPFLCAAEVGRVLHVPIAHGEGNYTADGETLKALNAESRVLVRYCDAGGRITPEANPNGSMENIAGICNERRNVFGLMPHPERACDPKLLSVDGRLVFESLVMTLGKSRAA
jgi:phosphoribosylformylglycinamidine synthase subunit PurQ / glutaminase